eukprot:m.84596 g.84596  ORF g.84596 m.84596 type:complete len:720 (-) comp9600_c1_seq1:230-2389(-)
MLYSLVTVLAMMCAGALAQTTPQLSASGPNITITTGTNGVMSINGDQVATMTDVSNNIGNLGDDQALLATQMSTLAATLQNTITQMSTLNQQVQGCTENGQLYDQTQGQCVSPRPSPSSFATSGRMLAAEQDIDAIELQLNQTTGNHSFCSICPAQQYVSQACTATNGTQCSACPTGNWSRGGYAEQCMSCADNVDLCGYATCSNISDTICLMCNQVVQDGSAYILSGRNTCTRCSASQYRSDNQTCTPCPKDNSCAAATCQANSGVTMVTGQASMSSVYLPALNSVSLSDYLARWNDGVTGYNPIGPHSGTDTSLGNLVNPWLQVDVGSTSNLQGLDRIVFYNRPGNCGSRTFTGTTGCANIFGQANRVWNATGQGAVLGVSDSPLTASNTQFPTTMCTNPGDRNCLCGRLTQYNTTNNGVGPYIVPCNGAVGQYVFVGLPGTTRMLNFGEMEIWGTYVNTAPGYSFCTTPCQAANCMPGMSSCSGGQSTAQCQSGGCVDTVTNGVAYGFSSTNNQCVQCGSTQYRNAAGTCVNCPASCGGQPCQVQNSAVSGGTPSHGPNQWRGQVAALATDTSMTTYSETGTAANPWWQLNMGSVVAVASVDIVNRPDNCGARLFNGITACQFNVVYPGSQYDREFNATTQGATISVSNTSCSGSNTCPGTLCNRLTRPSTTGNSYTVQCQTPVWGQYVNIQLPGNRRILQLANVQVNRVTSQPTC